MSIELQTGNMNEVSSASDSELYAALFGEGDYIVRHRLDAEMVDSNTLSVGSGNAIQNGRHIRLKGSTEFVIPSGVQAQKRSNLAVLRTTVTRDEETMQTVEETVPLVLSGEPTMDGSPVDPDVIEGNLLEGDTIADFPLFRVVTDGINAGEPEPLYDFVASETEFRDSLSQSKQITLAQHVVLTIGRECVTLDIESCHAENVGKYLSVKVPEQYRPPSVKTAAMSCVNGYSAGLSVYADGSIYVRSYGGSRASAYGQVSWVPASILGDIVDDTV